MDSYQFAKICELLRDILNAESQQSTKICEKLSEIMRKLEHFQMQIEDCRHHIIECATEERADVGVAVVHQIDLTWPQIDLKSTPSRLDLFQLT